MMHHSVTRCDVSVCETSNYSGEEDAREDELSERRVRWRSLSACGGRGSHKGGPLFLFKTRTASAATSPPGRSPRRPTGRTTRGASMSACSRPPDPPRPLKPGFFAKHFPAKVLQGLIFWRVPLFEESSPLANEVSHRVWNYKILGEKLALSP